MSNVINASFEVTSWDEQPFDERPDGSKLTSAKVSKSYRGGIEGESVTQWLMAYADDGTATFVGIERITGHIQGRSGTLVLRHVGRYRDGSATAELYVAPGSASGELAGTTGHGQFSADPSGRVRLELTMAEAHDHRSTGQSSYVSSGKRVARPTDSQSPGAAR